MNFLPPGPTKLSGRETRVELLRCVIELIKTVRASWKRSSKSSLCWALEDGVDVKRHVHGKQFFLRQGEENAPASEFNSPTKYDWSFSMALLKSVQRVELSCLSFANRKSASVDQVNSLWQRLWALLQNGRESNYWNTGGTGAAQWYRTLYPLIEHFCLRARPLLKLRRFCFSSIFVLHCHPLVFCFVSVFFFWRLFLVSTSLALATLCSFFFRKKKNFT